MLVRSKRLRHATRKHLISPSRTDLKLRSILMIVGHIDGRIARAIIRHWLSQYRKSTCRHQRRALNLWAKPLAEVDDVLSRSRGYLLSLYSIAEFCYHFTLWYSALANR